GRHAPAWRRPRVGVPQRSRLPPARVPPRAKPSASASRTDSLLEKLPPMAPGQGVETCKHVCFGASTFVQLTGKGRKERTVPLWPTTSQVLKTWFAELGAQADRIAFPSAKGKVLSRDGVDYLLQQAIQRALPACPSLATKHISPHVIRHYLPFLTMLG